MERPKRLIARYEDKPLTKKELTEHYNPDTPLRRALLVVDADGLTASEKSVLFVLAVRCGGKGVGGDPGLSYLFNRSVAAGAGVGISTLADIWRSLSKPGLVTCEGERPNGAILRRVHWDRLREMSYRWRDAERRESQHDQAPACSNDAFDDVDPTDV